MTKNPYINAVLAVAYIALVVMILTVGPKLGNNGPDNLLAPMAALSLFVLSAAFMGYVFFFQPVMLFLDGKKREAVELFLRTLGTFAAITGIIVIVAFATS